MHQFYFTVIFIVNAALFSVESIPLSGRTFSPGAPASGTSLNARAPASSKCPYQSVQYTGWRWALMLLFAIVLVLLTGILAGLTLAVMSVDVTRLRVWVRTGGEKQRIYAARILEVRSRPNWLLVSLIIASVMVAEGLPLVLNFLVSPRANWAPYFISTTAIALFGEIIPQAIMPLYILEIGGRTMWFLKCVMLFLALPACVPAYALRRFRKWRVGENTDKTERTDGIMEADELMEFIRLHEQGQRFGGPLTDEGGAMARSIVIGQHQLIGKYVRPWMNCTVLDANTPINAVTLTRIRSSNDSYVLVAKGNAMRLRADVGGNGETGEEDTVGYHKPRNDGVELHGILFPKDFINPNIQQKLLTVADLPLRHVPIVQASSSTHELISLLTRTRHPCAIVVESLGYALRPDVADITPHLLEIGAPNGESLTLVGIVDYHTLVAQVLLGHSMAHHPERSDGPSNFDSDSVAPSPLPSPSPMLDDAPVSKKEKRKNDTLNDDRSKQKGTYEMHQRSVSLGSPAVTVSMRANVGSEFSQSTGGLRRRPRQSVLEVFKFKNEGF